MIVRTTIDKKTKTVVLSGNYVIETHEADGYARLPEGATRVIATIFTGDYNGSIVQELTDWISRVDAEDAHERIFGILGNSDPSNAPRCIDLRDKYATLEPAPVPSRKPAQPPTGDDDFDDSDPFADQ